MKKMLITVMAAFAASAALAADRVWTGGGANHAWTNALNWTDGRVPGDSDTAVFNLSGDEYVYLVKTTANESVGPDPKANFISGAILLHSAKISAANCSARPTSCVLWARGVTALVSFGVSGGNVS